MATIIRLARGGRVHHPVYRITVADSRRRPTGKFLERIGQYDPNQKPPLVKINEESAIKWLQNGAQMSDTVRGLLTRYGTLEKWEQVKSGTPFEQATSTPIEWKPKDKKTSKKSLEKMKAETTEVTAKESAKEEVKAKSEEVATEESAKEEVKAETTEATAKESAEASETSKS